MAFMDFEFFTGQNVVFPLKPFVQHPIVLHPICKMAYMLLFFLCGLCTYNNLPSLLVRKLYVMGFTNLYRTPTSTFR